MLRKRNITKCCFENKKRHYELVILPEFSVNVICRSPVLSGSILSFIKPRSRGGFRRGLGMQTSPSPQGFDPLPTQRVPPLCTILRYPNWVTDPKNVLKEPLAPIYTNFKGGARAKKTQFFWTKFSKKWLKTPFLACFSEFWLRRRKFDQNEVFLVLWESSENKIGST